MLRRDVGGVNSEIPWTAIVLVRSNLWPNYYLPFLVRAGHLKPLGKPAHNARKWFATIEIERMSRDPDWTTVVTLSETTNEHTHCGVCSQCIDRRFGIIAAQAEEFDPVTQYRLGIFTQSPPKNEDR